MIGLPEPVWAAAKAHAKNGGTSMSAVLVSWCVRGQPEDSASEVVEPTAQLSECASEVAEPTTQLGDRDDARPAISRSIAPEAAVAITVSCPAEDSHKEDVAAAIAEANEMLAKAGVYLPRTNPFE